jgi:hypothetical protein
MWDYIVLGQVPGTHFQVSFEIWLLSMTGLLFSCLVLLAARSSFNKQLLIAFRISRVLQTAAYTQWLITRRHIQA